MKKLNLAICCLMMLSFQLLAQSPPILCGNSVFNDIVHHHYPALQEEFNTTFELCKRAPSLRSGEQLVVNVVVHVVWKEEAENLDEAIILDQLRILNEDFNKLNADHVNLRPYFQAQAGSAGIEFRLAGIVRVQTDVEFAIDIAGTNLLPEVKHTGLGGSDAWDTEQYINIWVCKIQPIEIFGIEIGQILGFAFPPNNLSNWPDNSGSPNADEDGVVIDYRVFGSNNPNGIEVPGGGGSLVIKGRTPVHEVGHYLGLRHIWGDGGLLGPNDCAQSDGIDDTPFANAQSAFDCDTNKNTCALVEVHYKDDTPDLVENYMDYASEECMNMFTNGQVALMRGVLNGPRSGLLTPLSGVTGTDPDFPFSVVPNPSEGPFEIQFETTRATACLIRLLDTNGQVVESRGTETFLPGKHSVSFEGHMVPAGMYLVEIRNETGHFTRKIIRF